MTDPSRTPKDGAELPILPVAMEQHPGVISMRNEIASLRFEISTTMTMRLTTENARLRSINADMLAALEEVRRRLRVPPTPEGEATYKQLCAAITKARGDSQ